MCESQGVLSFAPHRNPSPLPPHRRYRVDGADEGVDVFVVVVARHDGRGVSDDGLHDRERHACVRRERDEGVAERMERRLGCKARRPATAVNDRTTGRVGVPPPYLLGGRYAVRPKREASLRGTRPKGAPKGCASRRECEPYRMVANENAQHSR